MHLAALRRMKIEQRLEDFADFYLLIPVLFQGRVDGRFVISSAGSSSSSKQGS